LYKSKYKLAQFKGSTAKLTDGRKLNKAMNPEKHAKKYKKEVDRRS
jgi:hypothetical protein